MCALLTSLGATAEAGRARPLHHQSAAAAAATDASATPTTVPSDASSIGGYNILIADRGNNRIILVSPEKKILWEYDYEGMPMGAAADDAFFTDGGKTIITSLEHEQIIQLIDVATKKVTWEYGVQGKSGSKPGMLYYPDDAYKLPSGNIIVADIRNCRVLEIAPDKSIVRQAGVTGRCAGKWPVLQGPNGDTPLPNGHIMISEIIGHSITEIDESWKPVVTVRLPFAYPSDPQPSKSGNIIIAAYERPGRIIEVTREGKILWDYGPKSGEGMLNRPSLAFELPNGNIMTNDDMNHRVLVIDRNTKQIVWQYGQTGRPGKADGFLSIPDGMDIIKAN